MKMKMFENVSDLNKFLELYTVSEVIITNDPVGRWWVWVDRVKDPLKKDEILCPQCKKMSPYGQFCTRCGNDLL